MTAFQYVFRFFEDGLRSQTGVISLCPFRPEVVKPALLDDFNESAVGKVRCCGGQLKDLAYSSWLKWSTPLSPSNWGQC